METSHPKSSTEHMMEEFVEVFCRQDRIKTSHVTEVVVVSSKKRKKEKPPQRRTSTFCLPRRDRNSTKDETRKLIRCVPRKKRRTSSGTQRRLEKRSRLYQRSQWNRSRVPRSSCRCASWSRCFMCPFFMSRRRRKLPNVGTGQGSALSSN